MMVITAAVSILTLCVILNDRDTQIKQFALSSFYLCMMSSLCQMWVKVIVFPTNTPITIVVLHYSAV